MGRGEQLEARREGRTEEVMEHKHIGLQSPGQDSQQREKHPHKHQQNGATRLGIIHSVSSTGELEENTVNGSGWVYPPTSLSLSHSHESCPSLALYRDL